MRCPTRTGRTTDAEVLIYLNRETGAPGIDEEPIRIHSAADIERVDLEEARLLRVDPSAGLEEVLEALLQRLLS